MYSEVQLRSNILYSVGFTFVLHGKVHANYMTGVTSIEYCVHYMQIHNDEQ